MALAKNEMLAVLVAGFAGRYQSGEANATCLFKAMVAVRAAGRLQGAGVGRNRNPCPCARGLHRDHRASGVAHLGRTRGVLDNGRWDTANLAKSLAQHAELTIRAADAVLTGIVE